MAESGLSAWQIHWMALFTKFQNAAVTGGALAGIKNVEKVTPPELKIFPSVGVQFDHFTEEVDGMRRHLVTSTFNIVVAVLQEFNELIPDTSNAALATLQNYVNDGAGNGIEPLLRADPTLGGFAARSQITSLIYAVLESETRTAGQIATAVITFITESHVSC